MFDKKVLEIKSNNSVDRLDSHSLCFFSPVDDPACGIPLGDGSTGTLICPEKNKLSIMVNHTDLWDLVDGDEIANWNHEEEENTNSLKHAGKVEIDFHSPVFDIIYQKDYKAILSLKDACLNINSKTPFSEVNIKAFASNEYGVTVISVDSKTDEENEIDISLQNWGSRTFGHWYAQVNSDASIGIDDNVESICDNGIYIVRRLREKSFCIGLMCVAESETKYRRYNRHSANINVSPNKNHKTTIYLTVTIAGNDENARKEANNRLLCAIDNADNIFDSHCKQWYDFWSKSYIELDQPYIESTWYLNSYYANSEMRGEFPAHFCNGAWGFNHDFVPWTHFFHWNMQLQYWANFASGHPELIKPYLDFRYKQLPKAMKFAKKIRNVEGALYTDVSGANGACDINTCHNLTPGAQIAENFWKYYLFTGDFDYLCEKGFPVIFYSALLYVNILKKEDDGFYHLCASQAYEASPLMDDVITDHSAMRVVIPIAIKCMELLDKQDKLEKYFDRRREWQEIVENLAPIKTIPLEDDEYYVLDGKKYYSVGFGKGREILKDCVPVTGVYAKNCREAFDEDTSYWNSLEEGTLIRTTFRTEKRKRYYGFPDPEYSAVFPNSIIGLRDKYSDLFYAMQNIMFLKEPFELADEDPITINPDDKIDSCGWSLDPIIMARLGMGEELLRKQKDMIEAWQWFPNGFGGYHGYPVTLREVHMRFHTRKVFDCATMKNIKFPSWDFRHFDFETMPIIAMSVNEMLLQSYDGRIRVFPACTQSFTGSFKLQADCGAVVYSQMTDGKVDFVLIEALKDTEICLVNPWDNEVADIYSVGGIKDSITFNLDIAESLASFILGKNESVLIVPNSFNLEKLDVRKILLNSKSGVKKLGRARLGIERMY